MCYKYIVNESQKCLTYLQVGSLRFSTTMHYFIKASKVFRDARDASYGGNITFGASASEGQVIPYCKEGRSMDLPIILYDSERHWTVFLDYLHHIRPTKYVLIFC